MAKVRVFLGNDEVFEVVPLVRDLMLKKFQALVSGEEIRRCIRFAGYPVEKQFGRLFATKDVVADIARQISSEMGF